MKPAVYSGPSKSDLDEIGSYLREQAGDDIARSVLSNIYSTIDTVALFPHAGRSVNQRDDRCRPCVGNAKNWVVYWRVRKDDILIVRIIRGERGSIRRKLGET